METALALAAVKAVQIPLALLTALDLTGPLWPRHVKVKNRTCFDYIIIGSGTAGSIVANRLTEDENIRVLVIEAGIDPPIETLFPLLFVTEPGSEIDWKYFSTYDPYAANSQKFDKTMLTAGKTLGGSSSLSHFIMVRGAPDDFDSWADFLDDPSWSYDNVLPYFKKSENLTDPVIKKSPYVVYHGLDGYAGVDRQPHLEANNYLVSFAEVGKKVVLDVNGHDTLGYTQSLFSVSGGIRQHTAYAYLRPITKRKNLFVLRKTMATRIIFDSNKKAVAVEAVRKGKRYIYRASKEIIVCAGVYNTPQLLMLSGIGPREHLESLGIDVIADLPVGDNFQDQVGVSILHKMEVSIAPPPLPIPTEVPFPVLVGLTTLNETQSYADYEIFGLILPHDSQMILLACGVVFGYKTELCDVFNIAATGRNTLYTLLTKLKPKSRGNIRLNSTNPFDAPIITTGTYTNEADLDDMVEYVKDYLKVVNSTYFDKVKSEIIDPGHKECEKFEFGSDEYWRCYILHTTCSLFHTTSTCPMGTVVDSKLRVNNVENLRVVDASVIPYLPSGNPYAVVLMIAEKASDMIKEDVNDKPSCNTLDGSKKCVCNNN